MCVCEGGVCVCVCVRGGVCVCVRGECVCVRGEEGGECVGGEEGGESVFSPEFTDQRAQIISHDHAPHLECSGCQYQTFVACVLLSTKHFQFSLSSIFRAQTVFKFK